jgi:hypothetical protein
VGRGSFGYLVAQLAVETGIPPQQLLDLDSTMFKNMLKVLQDRAKDMENANRARGRGSASRRP